MRSKGKKDNRAEVEKKEEEEEEEDRIAAF